MGNILESIYNYNKLNENKKLNKKLNEYNIRRQKSKIII